MGFYGKHKIIFALVLFVLGIVVCESVNISKNILLLITSITTLLYFFKKDFLLIAFLPLAILLSQQTKIEKPFSESLLNKKITVSGKLFKNPEKRKNSWRLFINVREVKTRSQKLKTNFKIVAYSKKLLPEAYYGSGVEIKNIKLDQLSEFKNPGSFSLKKHFNNKGILYTAFVNNPKNIKTFGLYEKKDFILFKLNKFRKCYEDFVRANLANPESEIINAITIGAKGAVPEKVREDFSKLGISHLLAISGLHVGAISLFIFFIVKWLLKRSEYFLLMYEVPKIASVLTIIPVIIYAFIAGLATPVVRASIMITIYFLTVFFNRDESKANILAAAAIVILFFDPNSLFDLSFQLSFTAVSGIIFFHHFFPFKLNSTRDKIATMIKTTVAATFFTLPFIINNFGYLPVSTIPANLIAVPLVEFLVVPMGLLSLIVFPVSQHICEILLVVNSKILNSLLYFVEYIVGFRYSYFTVPNIDKLGYLLLIITTLIVFFSRLSKKIVYFALITFLGFTFTLFDNTKNSNSKNEMKIYFLDAGRKSYNLFVFPNNKTILASGGYSYLSKSDFAENAAVIPFLLKQGITKLDYLWLLSTDKSHLKGAQAIAKRVNVENIWTNGGRLDGRLWEIMREKDIKWKNMQDDLEELHFGSAKIAFIKPNVQNKIWDSREPKPMVMIVNHFENKVLISEGLGKDYIQSELTEIYKKKIKSDVVLINNIRHFDKQFASFVKATQAKTFITNSFSANGSQDLLFNTQLYITSISGMITLYSNKEELNFKSYN